MKILFLALTLLILSGCNSKRPTINDLICPEGHSTHQIQKDLTECKYYDQKKAAEASESQLEPACIKCLEDRGYELE